jgi:predicted Zn-dependent protease with MMP-like domain
MDLNELTDFTTRFATGLPRQIGKQLADVEILVSSDPQTATTELSAILTTEDGQPIDAIPGDCKGCFIGSPMEQDETDDEEGDEFETVELPNGVILLVASNIPNTDEAVLVLLHEIGHALGMDEDEVKELGLGVSPSGAGASNGSDTPKNVQ